MTHALGTAPHRIFLPLSLAAFFLLSPAPVAAVVEQGAWSAVPVLSQLPNTRVESSSAYDPIHQRWIVFGGQGLGDTYALNLGSLSPAWSNLNPVNSPGVRRAVSLVFDPLRARMILFGGDDGSSFHNDVWALNLDGAPTWTQITPLGTPPPGRMWSLGAYDPVRDRMLFFGGYNNGQVFGDVWALNLGGGSSWSQITPVPGPAPDARWSCVGGYDPVGDRLILALGLGAPDTYKADTWALNLSGTPTWTQFSITGPLPRFLSTGVVEPQRNRLIVYGGYPNGAGEVWALNFGPPSWDFLVPSGSAPPGRRAHVAIFQPESSRMLTLGGVGMTNDAFAITFAAPPGLPAITGFQPPGGPAGTEVRIVGTSLEGATSVDFNGASATILSTAPSEVHAVVPAGATTGKIHVVTPAGSAISFSDFTVGTVPILTSATPDSGRVRTKVVLRGADFTSATRVSFGGGGRADFTVLSDTVIVATVDTLAVTGHVFVFGPSGPGESAFDFRVIPFDPRPRMTSVRDVPHDQGGHVLVRWEGSDLDVPWRRSITGYRVWRRAAPAAPGVLTKPVPAPLSAPRGTPAADVYWEAVATLPAANLEGYAYTAATPYDSTGDSNAPVAFFVQAITTDAFTTYSSSPDSGYSVDNLSPPQPAPFAADYGTYQVAMHWRASRAADFAEFRLYRGAGADFPLDPAHRVAVTRDTAYVDAAPGAPQSTYKLVAVDVHGNPSRVALVSPDLPVATLASFVSATASEKSIQLTWYSGGNTGMVVSVSRRDESSDWVTLGEAIVDGSGYVRFEDDDVTAGTRYAYRLGIDDGEAMVFTPEVWVVASTPVFAMLGPWPNPVAGGRFSVAFLLPTPERGTLELWDVAGRRVDRREISGTSRQVVSFGDRGRLAPGLYLLRLKQGIHLELRRVAVLD